MTYDLFVQFIILRYKETTCSCSSKTTFNVYVFQRSQIEFEDEDHAVYMSFCWVTTTLSSLRTTTCDALIVPSDSVFLLPCLPPMPFVVGVLHGNLNVGVGVELQLP